MLLFVLFVLITGLGGQHGPARHTASGNPGVEISLGSIILPGFLFVSSAALNWNWMTAKVVRSDHESDHTGPRRIWWAAILHASPSMIMTSDLRKFALAAHITSSVGLLGAVATFLALAITGLTSQDAQLVRAAYLAMELNARLVIVPLAFSALVFGIVQALGTKWGLFRHWWVLVKLLTTVLVIIVLLQQMDTINLVANAAAQAALSDVDLRGARSSLVIHAGLGLLVLLIPVALSLYKPRGLTRYGARIQREMRSG